jgi:hypothetical protein
VREGLGYQARGAGSTARAAAVRGWGSLPELDGDSNG